MTGFEHLTNSAITLSPVERDDIETLWHQLNTVDTVDPTGACFVCVTPERRALLKLVLMAGLASIDAGNARYNLNDESD